LYLICHIQMMKQRIKNIGILLVLPVLVASCQTRAKGDVVGIQGRKSFYPTTPVGMVAIPGGNYEMGNSEEDIAAANISKKRAVTVSSFYMDELEMSNNKYRQFVFWVRDSVIREYAAASGYIYREEFYVVTDKEGRDLVKDLGKEQYPINWKVGFDFRKSDKLDPDSRGAIEKNFYFTQGKAANVAGSSIDAEKLNYQYYWIDYQSASASSKNMGSVPSSDTSAGVQPLGIKKTFQDLDKFVYKEVVSIYPDTLVWLKDFPGSFNDPLLEQYFSHPAYDEYPVVGVSWRQARAFSYWRTSFTNSYKKNSGAYAEQRFRLPTEAEWEWAARGGVENSPYPWGTPYVRDKKGCFIANFKPYRGRYSGENGMVLVPVDNYPPNQYGLYNMAGNVSEWTSGTFHESAYEFVLDMNPNLEYMTKEEDALPLRRKVVRGGSWKDISYFLQTGTRSYEYEDTARSYIGFRMAKSYLGVLTKNVKK